MIKRTKPLYHYALIAKKLSYCSFPQNFEKQIKRVSACGFFAQRQQISQLDWSVLRLAGRSGSVHEMDPCTVTIRQARTV